MSCVQMLLEKDCYLSQPISQFCNVFEWKGKLEKTFFFLSKKEKTYEEK